MDGSLVLRPLHSAHVISLVSFICISEGGIALASSVSVVARNGWGVNLEQWDCVMIMYFPLCCGLHCAFFYEEYLGLLWNK